MGFAEEGLAQNSLVGHQPIPAAAVAAEIEDGTDPAFLRKGAGCGDEALSLGTAEHLRKAVGVDIPQFSFVCYVKVAGVDTAVTLHHKLDGTPAVHTAGLRPLA